MKRMIAALLALGTAIPVVPSPATPVPACGWPMKSDLDTLNVAFPDDAAIYWVTRFVSVPGARLRIEGRFPDARYISFHAYDEAQRPVDGLADVQIDALDGEPHRFRNSDAPPGGRYEVAVAFTPEPAEPAPNTLYAGGTQEGNHNPAGFIIYRVYVPKDEADPTGGVGVPDVTLEGPEGAVSLEFARCEPLPPSIGGTLNDAAKRSDYPDGAPRAVPFPGAGNPPSFTRFYGLDRLVWSRIPGNPVTDQVPRSRGGFLSNEHVAYLTSRIARTFGEVVVMRFLPPSFPDTRAGESPTAPRQLRYWSVCQNEFVSQRVVECLTDHEAVHADDGAVLIVISDPGDRPTNARPEDGVNWIPWGGPYYDGTIIYRHMLPAPEFAQAVQNIPEFTDAAATMREYMPVARYCPKATFEGSGWDGCVSLPVPQGTA